MRRIENPEATDDLSMKLALRRAEVELGQKDVLEFLGALAHRMSGHLGRIEPQLLVNHPRGVPAFGNGESFRKERVDPPPCTSRASRSLGDSRKSLVAKGSLVASLREVNHERGNARRGSTDPATASPMVERLLESPAPHN